MEYTTFGGTQGYALARNKEQTFSLFAPLSCCGRRSRSPPGASCWLEAAASCCIEYNSSAATFTHSLHIRALHQELHPGSTCSLLPYLQPWYQGPRAGFAKSVGLKALLGFTPRTDSTPAGHRTLTGRGRIRQPPSSRCRCRNTSPRVGRRLCERRHCRQKCQHGGGLARIGACRQRC